MKTRRQKSAHAPTMAAGGIVVKAGRFPLIAVVQRRKDGGWVLPRGKQKPEEGALAAARGAVEKETGHNVVVQEFLGTISSESRGRPKIIQFWLMVSVGPAGQEPMDDNQSVKWLPLNAAVACLTEPLEQAFLAHIGQRSLPELRGGLRRGKSRVGGNNFAGKLRPTREFGKSPNGRKASTLRANTRAGSVPCEEQSFRAKPQNRASTAPNFIRRFFRRFKSPRHTSNQSTGWLS